MPRAVVGAGPYKGVWYLPDKLQFCDKKPAALWGSGLSV